MSEASQSLHFWRTGIVTVRALALSSAAAGRIVAKNDRWTTFVPVDEDDGLTMLAATSGLCLRWLYFEDFGLGLEFWEGGSEFGRAEFHWQTCEDQLVSTGLDRLGELGLFVSMQSLSELARGVAGRSALPMDLRDQAAILLDLPAYQWLSPASVLDTPIEIERERFPEAEDVDPV